MDEVKICPWCAYALLSQTNQGKKQYYCLHCREVVHPDILQKHSALAIAAPQVGFLETLDNSPVGKNNPKHNLDKNLLLDYVAYFISRGKELVNPGLEKLKYTGKVYDYVGYTPEFLEFWDVVKARRDFTQLHIGGDVYCFGQFLSGSFEIKDCARCDLPIPQLVDHATGTPACNLCDLSPGFQALQILIIGFTPDQEQIYQRMLRLNGVVPTFSLDLWGDWHEDYHVIFLAPLVTPDQSQFYLQQLHQHQAQQPMVALSPYAGDGGPWVRSSLSPVDYIVKSLSGDRLLSCLRYLHTYHRGDSQLYWFPR